MGCFKKNIDNGFQNSLPKNVSSVISPHPLFFYLKNGEQFPGMKSNGAQNFHLNPTRNHFMSYEGHL